MVVGKKHENRMRLESMPGIRWVCMDDDVVIVVGDSEPALSATLADIRKVTDRTTGELIVPLQKKRLFIGTGRQNINSSTARTGCRADNPGNDERWILEGKTRPAVEEFIRSAISLGRATSGRVTGNQQLTILDRSEGSPPTLHPVSRRAPISRPSSESNVPAGAAPVRQVVQSLGQYL
jgi:hypothetical protein